MLHRVSIVHKEMVLVEEMVRYCSLWDYSTVAECRQLAARRQRG